MLLLVLLFSIFILILNSKKEHFSILDDVKGFGEKIKNIKNDIKNLPNKIKKEVVDPVIIPIKEFMAMVKNIRMERR